MTDDSISNIFHSTKMINQFSGQYILHQRIHREISSFSRFLRPQKWIYIHSKIFVSAAGSLFFSRHGDIHVISLQPENAKISPHLRSFPQSIQNLTQTFWCDSMNLYINIFVLFAHDLIPDIAPHKKSSSSFLSNPGSNFFSHNKILILQAQPSL